MCQFSNCLRVRRYKAIYRLIIFGKVFSRFNTFSKEVEFSKKLLSAKKPIIIIGESALGLKSGKYIFEEIKNFLKNNNFITKDWNALNFLPQNLFFL